MNRHLFLTLGAVVLAACASSQKKKPTVAELRGSAAVLAGEWEVPSNPSQYLLFKPDPGERKSGRFGGIEDYGYYRIKSGLMAGSRIVVELQSVSADTNTPTIDVTVVFAPDGKSLNLSGHGISHRTYRKVQL